MSTLNFRKNGLIQSARHYLEKKLEKIISIFYSLMFCSNLKYSVVASYMEIKVIQKPQSVSRWT